ncbi:hypothetical protein INS49_000251 [Diaporthe citri]|uniref:uncharacterized protein n=1 Tax=Diaporthe citri TaxID=83186 RepID=UPI001C81C9DF|nr:uncharacterized protein INS49_000251 [Diaporthe citri]KAG6366075.1 hypothetical protein INS49_000251 [Diaporthe citri]
MGTKTLNRKPSLVDRLRQLRSAAPSPSKATFMPEKRPPYVPIQPVDEHPATHFRDEGPRNPISNPRSRSYYPEKGLDLDELDFKLEQYAKRSLESAETQTDTESDVPLRREISSVQQMNDQASTADDSDEEPERDPSWCLEPVTSLQPPSQGVGSVESCLTAPQQAPGEPKPSDYEIFMREAEEAERQRVENKDKPSRPTREPPLNPFYSHNWDHQPQPSPKLAEIQEAADDGAREDREVHDAAPGDQDSDRQALSSETSSERGDANAAPPKSTISRANTDVTGGGRHIKFSDTCAPRERVERRASAPSCATRVKSPSRPVRKQKSIKQLIADYIRPPRG